MSSMAISNSWKFSLLVTIPPQDRAHPLTNQTGMNLVMESNMNFESVMIATREYPETVINKYN